MRGVLVPADHEAAVRVVELPPPDTGEFLDELYRLVGVGPGELDATYVARGVRAWVDDTGAYRASVNERATAFRARGAREVGADGHPFPMPLYGDVVLIGPVVGEDESEAPGWLLELATAGAFESWCAA